MENNFGKRILITKTSLVSDLMMTGNLKKVEGSRNAGYFDLEEIFKCLNPLLIKNEVDIDVNILKERVIVKWIDCLSDSIRDIEIDFTSLIDLEKLSLMKNKVQSEGAKQTYIRRYALNCALNLPSGDEIDNKNWNKPTSNPNPPAPVFEGLSQNQLSELEKHDQDIVKFVIKKSSYGIITNIPSLSFNTLLNNVKDLETKKAEKEKAEKAEKTKEPEKETPYVPNTKMLYTIATDAKVSRDNVHKYIKKKFGIDSTKELTSIQFDLTIQDLEKQKAILERKVLEGNDLPISPDNFAKPADDKKK